MSILAVIIILVIATGLFYKLEADELKKQEMPSMEFDVYDEANYLSFKLNKPCRKGEAIRIMCYCQYYSYWSLKEEKCLTDKCDPTIGGTLSLSGYCVVSTIPRKMQLNYKLAGQAAMCKVNDYYDSELESCKSAKCPS
eukprot:CAMPEP_0170503626 /NCGR_PEP_ID=MMETSP0208-20121228/45401_1 /TAXON_ID=197538 /ORGANISM="Strombidium inclinatum, Strain S3" /LENGTH=138 /DNA_ID=CAMNT_0010783379 /DNA_START=42 /DNA_END=458 /DNA_ORIENTATION=-